jgi:hypothetical protein
MCSDVKSLMVASRPPIIFPPESPWAQESLNGSDKNVLGRTTDQRMSDAADEKEGGNHLFAAVRHQLCADSLNKGPHTLE